MDPLLAGTHHQLVSNHAGSSFGNILHVGADGGGGGSGLSMPGHQFDFTVSKQPPRVPPNQGVPESSHPTSLGYNSVSYLHGSSY